MILAYIVYPSYLTQLPCCKSESLQVCTEVVRGVRIQPINSEVEFINIVNGLERASTRPSDRDRGRGTSAGVVV